MTYLSARNRAGRPGSGQPVSGRTLLMVARPSRLGQGTDPAALLLVLFHLALEPVEAGHGPGLLSSSAWFGALTPVPDLPPKAIVK